MVGFYQKPGYTSEITFKELLYKLRVAQICANNERICRKFISLFNGDNIVYPG